MSQQFLHTYIMVKCCDIIMCYKLSQKLLCMLKYLNICVVYREKLSATHFITYDLDTLKKILCF